MSSLKELREKFMEVRVEMSDNRTLVPMTSAEINQVLTLIEIAQAREEHRRAKAEMYADEYQ